MAVKKADTKRVKVDTKKEESIAVPIPVPIEWYVPEGTMTPFASNMVVQITEGMFKVSFFEIKPPILIDKSAPPPSKIRADCVASVFIMPEKLPKFIEVLQRNYEKYMSLKQAK